LKRWITSRTVLIGLDQLGDHWNPVSARRSGAVGRDQADQWLDEQRRRAEAGRFLIAIPFFVASASAAQHQGPRRPTRHSENRCGSECGAS
jgi:hypothetical protein